MRLFENWMAKIEICRKLLNASPQVFAQSVVLFLLFSANLHSQGIQEGNRGRKSIDLKNADEDTIENDSTGNEMHRLTGNVLFFHNNISLSCDSAHYFPALKQIIAYQRVHIEQGDTLDLYSDYLFYDGKNETALLCNDRLGLLPLYYYESDQVLLFAGG